MKIVAVITDTEEVKKIIRHLAKTGRRCPQGENRLQVLIQPLSIE